MFSNTNSASQLIAQTSAGLLSGKYEEGVIMYRGVPFAQPSTGALSFQPPEPVDSWSGVRDARVSGPASYQVNNTNKNLVSRIAREIYPEVTGIMAWPDYVSTIYHQLNVSEDCLYLDIQVPLFRKRLSLALTQHTARTGANCNGAVLDMPVGAPKMLSA